MNTDVHGPGIRVQRTMRCSRCAHRPLSVLICVQTVKSKSRFHPILRLLGVIEIMNERNSLALITGASSGIGAAFARKLSAQCYRLLLVARRKDRLDQLAAQLGNAEVLAADLSSDADLRRVEERICDETRLELLINNAGFGAQGGFLEGDFQNQVAMHQVHVIAIARLTHAALQGMVAREKGSIINVSSVASFFPFSIQRELWRHESLDQQFYRIHLFGAQIPALAGPRSGSVSRLYDHRIS